MISLIIGNGGVRSYVGDIFANDGFYYIKRFDSFPNVQGKRLTVDTLTSKFPFNKITVNNGDHGWFVRIPKMYFSVRIEDRGNWGEYKAIIIRYSETQEDGFKIHPVFVINSNDAYKDTVLDYIEVSSFVCSITAANTIVSQPTTRRNIGGPEDAYESRIKLDFKIDTKSFAYPCDYSTFGLIQNLSAFLYNGYRDSDMRAESLSADSVQEQYTPQEFSIYSPAVAKTGYCTESNKKGIYTLGFVNLFENIPFYLKGIKWDSPSTDYVYNNKYPYGEDFVFLSELQNNVQYSNKLAVFEQTGDIVFPTTDGIYCPFDRNGYDTTSVGEKRVIIGSNYFASDPFRYNHRTPLSEEFFMTRVVNRGTISSTSKCYTPILKKKDLARLTVENYNEDFKIELFKNGQLVDTFSSIADLENQPYGSGVYECFFVDKNGILQRSLKSNEISIGEYFSVNLYQNNAEPNRVDKTDYLVTRGALYGTLRNSTSIITPTVVIQVDEIPNFNYVYISKFNRYYYVTDIMSVRTGLWEISMSVDVLMSNKYKIATQVAVVARNENAYNSFIPDDRVCGTPQFAYSVFDGSVIKDMITNREVLLDGVWYVLNTISTYNAASVDQHGLPFQSGNVKSGPFNTCYTFGTYQDYIEAVTEIISPNFISNMFDAFQNYSEYILSLKATPFSPDFLRYYSADDEPLKIGTNILEGINGRLIKASEKIRLYSELPAISMVDFTDLTPYCKYFLYVPFYGTVEINSGQLQNNITRYLCYDVDLFTGDFTVFISETLQSDNIKPISDIYDGNMYITVPFGTTNQSDINRNAADLAITTATTLAGGLSKNIGLISSGKKMTTPKRKQISKKGMRKIEQGKQGITQDLISTGGDFISSLLTDFTPTATCYNTADRISLFHQVKTPFIVKVKGDYFRPTDYDFYNGRPLMQTKTLSEVHGYTEISQVHLENFDCTVDELDEIETMLIDGVILP